MKDVVFFRSLSKEDKEEDKRVCAFCNFVTFVVNLFIDKRAHST
jgi:hypothetical protein